MALIVGAGVISLLSDFSASPLLRVLQGVAVFAAGAVVLGVVVVFLLVRLAGWRDPVSERDFDALVERSERLADDGSWGDSDHQPGDESWDDDLLDLSDREDFQALVRSAIDDLPLQFHRALEHVAVVVSDGGRRRRAYGLYEGDTVARDHFHDRIVIFQDTLVRDFGHDPDLLRAQVTRTVRHELAHHLGWDEQGVQELGL